MEKCSNSSRQEWTWREPRGKTSQDEVRPKTWFSKRPWVVRSACRDRLTSSSVFVFVFFLHQDWFLVKLKCDLVCFFFFFSLGLVQAQWWKHGLWLWLKAQNIEYRLFTYKERKILEAYSLFQMVNILNIRETGAGCHIFSPTRVMHPSCCDTKQ